MTTTTPAIDLGTVDDRTVIDFGQPRVKIPWDQPSLTIRAGVRTITGTSKEVCDKLREMGYDPMADFDAIA